MIDTMIDKSFTTIRHSSKAPHYKITFLYLTACQGCATGAMALNVAPHFVLKRQDTYFYRQAASYVVRGRSRCHARPCGREKLGLKLRARIANARLVLLQDGRKLLKAGGAQEVVINFDNTNTI